MLRRSQLYVPGDNPSMIAKAPTLGADSIILDLEDAVSEERKHQARRLVARLSREVDWGGHELCVRINPRGSRHFTEDMAAIAACERIDSVVVPKARGDCSSVCSKTHKRLIPVIETGTGLMHIREIVSSKGVVAVSYGAADYAASVGGSVSAYLGNASIKTMIVAAAADAGVDAIDNVFFDLVDASGFRKQALEARSLGFVGKQVVHPSQVKLANEVFSPSEKEIEWAKRILLQMQSVKTGHRGAIRVDGSLVDAVHGRLAEGILERAKRARAFS